MNLIRSINTRHYGLQIQDPGPGRPSPAWPCSRAFRPGNHTVELYVDSDLIALGQFVVE